MGPRDKPEGDEAGKGATLRSVRVRGDERRRGSSLRLAFALVHDPGPRLRGFAVVGVGLAVVAADRLDGRRALVRLDVADAGLGPHADAAELVAAAGAFGAADPRRGRLAG